MIVLFRVATFLIAGLGALQVFAAWYTFTYSCMPSSEWDLSLSSNKVTWNAESKADSNLWWLVFPFGVN